MGPSFVSKKKLNYKEYTSNCPVCNSVKVGRIRDVGKLCKSCNCRKLGKRPREKTSPWVNRLDYFRDLTKRMKYDFDWRLRKCLNGARGRAKERGLDFDLTMEDMYELWPEDGLCPVLGIEMKFGDVRRNTPSLDRVDNTKGYTRDNCYIISMRANVLKSDATLEEIESIYHYMRGSII